MCDHQNFKAQVEVSRLTQAKGGHITGYSEDITILTTKK